MALPLVSILIPMYNASSFIEETLNCAQNQTYKNIEIIVSDDCSSDDSIAIVQKFAEEDSRIRLLMNAQNQGMCKNWNILFSEAKGEYLLKLDADDVIYLNFVETLLTKAMAHSADIVSAAYEVRQEVQYRTIPIHKVLNEGFVKNLVNTIIFNNPFHLVFSLLNAEFVKNISLNKPYFLETEVGDAEFLIRSALNGVKLYFYPEVLGYYRMHTTNSSRSPLKQTRSFYFDVLPIYHVILKKITNFNYKQKIRNDLIDYLKNIVKLNAPFDLQLLKQMIVLLVT
ncbi:MAG: glycosyltransferase family 2 protein [Flavobacterium sp.]|nr:glycosyltransferase family 2 protein [Flavobacterium sp.]